MEIKKSDASPEKRISIPPKQEDFKEKVEQLREGVKTMAKKSLTQ